MMPPQSHARGCSFDARTVLQHQHQMTMSHLQDTPPYTPRSKSLDLLRSDAVSPVPSRTSLDTLSTLKGHRISSPIFVNSSIGVKPVPGEPRHLDSPTIHETDFEDADQLDVFTSRTTDANHNPISTTTVHLPSTLHYVAVARTTDNALQPKTPSRRQKDNLLKSKFSMSPVQPSKRSKARNSEDRTYATFSIANRLAEGVISQDNARSTFGNWSHSLGMAARKLQKSALPRKASDESYHAAATTTTTMLEVHHEGVNEPMLTPEKAKNSLRSATSLASIRRFITPSRRTRKVSSTRGMAGSRRAMLTVDDVVVETLGGSEEGNWIDAEGRDSRDGLSQVGEALATSASNTHLKVPKLSGRSSKRSGKQTEDNSVAARRRGPLSPEFYEPPPQQRTSEEDGAEVTTDALYDEQRAAAPVPPSKGDPERSAEPAESIPDAGTDSAPAPGPGPSKLKTLQLLARRPFNAFGKKMREMEKSWWPSRGSQELPRPSVIGTEPEQVEGDARIRPTRRSEDLLARASPRVCDSTVMVQKSRSVELDRIQLSSKVVPLRPSGGVGYKRRPTIPDSFSKSPQELARKEKIEPPTKQTPNSQPRISNLRHPWMKQLQLPAVSQTASVGAAPTTDLGARQIWPKMVEEITSHRNIIPSVSLTAASVALSQPFPALPKKQQSPRRPPASLLGQSLPIPPRSGRSRASTISSQSSTTSSPSGKVIVSRRSYGQRLRSPSTREETGSIRSVGTSILFTESPPGSPGMRKLMSPYYVTCSPSAVRVRSPPTTVLLPKYSKRRGEKVGTLRRMPSSAFTDDSDMGEAQEWMDDDDEEDGEGYHGSTAAADELIAYRARREEVLPTIRPGFLEMTEATQTLYNLVRTFSGSSGSLSMHSSPYKKTGTPDRHVATPNTPRGLYGIMEADEHSFARPSPPPHHLPSPVRQRLISIASIVSTEANSSFEDSEELQKLLDSIMAADLGGGGGGGGGGSHDTSGSRDMALLSPFGSPVELRDSRAERGVEKEVKEKQAVKSDMPPPPKFLLNDRPISPPDSSWTHGCCASVEDGGGDVGGGDGSGGLLEQCRSAPRMSVVPPASVQQVSGGPLRTGAMTWSAGAASTHHDDSGYASFSSLNGCRVSQP